MYVCCDLKFMRFEVMYNILSPESVRNTNSAKYITFGCFAQFISPFDILCNNWHVMKCSSTFVCLYLHSRVYFTTYALYYVLQGLAVSNRYDDKHLMSNEVPDKTQSPLKTMYNAQSPSRNADCPSSSKPAMANRLLDWFSVVMADSKHRRQHPKSKGERKLAAQCLILFNAFKYLRCSRGRNTLGVYTYAGVSEYISQHDYNFKFNFLIIHYN